jgi:hypothetical protein
MLGTKDVVTRLSINLLLYKERGAGAFKILNTKINGWVILLLLFKEKIMFQSHFIKSNHRAIRKIKAATYFAPDERYWFSSQNVY